VLRSLFDDSLFISYNQPARAAEHVLASFIRKQTASLKYSDKEAKKMQQIESFCENLIKKIQKA
jgi:hypothetical protein